MTSRLRQKDESGQALASNSHFFRSATTTRRRNNISRRQSYCLMMSYEQSTWVLSLLRGKAPVLLRATLVPTTGMVTMISSGCLINGCGCMFNFPHLILSLIPSLIGLARQPEELPVQGWARGNDPCELRYTSRIVEFSASLPFLSQTLALVKQL
jgi:hypothetical protein